MSEVKEKTSIKLEVKEGYHGKNITTYLPRKNGDTWSITTHKTYRGGLYCAAKHIELKKESGFNVESFDMMSESIDLGRDNKARCTAKNLLTMQKAGIEKLLTLDVVPDQNSYVIT